MKKYLSPQEIKKLSIEEMKNLTQREVMPIYTPNNSKCIHSLNYSCCAWRAEEIPLPESIEKAVEICKPLWLEDGFQLTKWDIKVDMLHCCFSVKPEISPVKCMQRFKGRLDHALRKIKDPVKFSRKIAFRCLGENTRKIVNAYVQNQIKKSDYVDQRYKSFLNKFTAFEEKTKLEEAFSKYSGRYWFNIHLVIVVADRKNSITQADIFEKIKGYIFRIALKKECLIAHFAIMPDHIHISLRGNPEMSPLEIGLAFMNNLAYLLGNNQCWNCEFYVGTFSEYSLDKLR